MLIVVAIIAPALAGHCQALPCHLQSPSEAVLVPEGAGVHAGRPPAEPSITADCNMTLASGLPRQTEALTRHLSGKSRAGADAIRGSAMQRKGCSNVSLLMLLKAPK